MVPPTSPPEAKPAAAVRSDWARNRVRIHAAARELFAERGRDAVQFSHIAERAGVSRATLFRHIGSKDALVFEIYTERLADLDALARAAVDCPDPWRGFETMIRAIVRWMHEDRGLHDFVSDALRHDRYPDMRNRADDALGAVIKRAQANGSLWPDLRPSDLMPLLAFTAFADAQRLDGFTDVLLRGLRTAN